MSKTTFEFLMKRLGEDDLKSCPPQPDLLKRVMEKLDMVEKYKGKNEENNCFVTVYDDIFCPNI